MITYRQDQELPSYPIRWYEWVGPRRQLINFGAGGYTYRFLLIPRSGIGVGLDKTTGIYGYGPDVDPNIVVTWASGELNITPGIYRVHLTATKTGQDRVFSPKLHHLVEITPTVP